jgi:3-dehydroquinate synthetase
MIGPIESFELAHPRGATLLVYGAGAIAAGAGELAERWAGRRLFVVSARPILELHEAALAPLLERAASVTILAVPDGEAAKTVAEAERLWQALVAAGCRRDDGVVGFGGGSVTDLAGFVAGTFLRGVDWIGVPTTLLAQVDAADRRQDGVDLPAAKNAVGVFHHPLAVLGRRGRALDSLADAATPRAGRGDQGRRRPRPRRSSSVSSAAWSDCWRETPKRWRRSSPAAARAKAAARRERPARSADPDSCSISATLSATRSRPRSVTARIAHGDAVAHGMRFALALSRAADCDEVR